MYVLNQEFENYMNNHARRGVSVFQIIEEVFTWTMWLLKTPAMADIQAENFSDSISVLDKAPSQLLQTSSVPTV